MKTYIMRSLVIVSILFVATCTKETGKDAGKTAGDGTESDSSGVETPEPVNPKAGNTWSVDSIEFVWIPPGSFMMGSPSGEKGQRRNEKQHRITISKGFWLGKYEVTKSQWKSVMGTELWKGRKHILDDSDSPAVYVSWNDAQSFIRKLGGGYRLPTEAEWEYACRAGTTTAYSFGESESDLDEYAWYYDNADSKGEDYAHVVGQKKPNTWGLYDIHGNVFEWCSGWFDEYPSDSAKDPEGPSTGAYKLLRGGSWTNFGYDCRSAYRFNRPVDFRDAYNGFRVVRTP